MKNSINNFAFIDNQNLYLSIKNMGWILDFKRFRIYLRDKYNVKKAFLFIGYIQKNQVLYTKLQQSGYILVFKPILYLPKGKIKGNVDAELVLQTMIEYYNYDKAIIVTGDGDFFCLIEYLIKQNKLEKLIIPNRYSYSSLYKNHQEYISFMNSLNKKVGYK